MKLENRYGTVAKKQTYVENCEEITASRKFIVG